MSSIGDACSASRHSPRPSAAALLTVAVAGVLAGSTFANGRDSVQEPALAHGGVTLPLRATSYNAGNIGKAFLWPEGANTRILVHFSGVPPHVSRPVHVYTYIYASACSKLPSQPVWSLNERVLVNGVAGARGGSRGMFAISHTVPVALSELQKRPHAIALRTAPADGDQTIFCGDLGGHHSAGL